MGMQRRVEPVMPKVGPGLKIATISNSSFRYATWPVLFVSAFFWLLRRVVSKCQSPMRNLICALTRGSSSSVTQSYDWPTMMRLVRPESSLSCLTPSISAAWARTLPMSRCCSGSMIARTSHSRRTGIHSSALRSASSLEMGMVYKVLLRYIEVNFRGAHSLFLQIYS